MTNEEARRIEALRMYQLLDTGEEDDLDDLARLAAQIGEVPMALISLVDQDRIWIKSHVGLEAHELPRKGSFCTEAIIGGGLLEIQDSLQDDRFRNHPMVVGPPGIRFYAGIPLTSPEGYNIGTLCVLDTKPGRLTRAHRESLARLGRQVMLLLDARVKDRRFHEAHQELQDIKLALDAHAIVSITSADGAITQVNDHFCRISQYSREELIGKNHRMVNSGLHPREFFRELWDTVRQGKVWQGEIRNQARDGSYWWVDTTILPILDDLGKPSQFIAVHSDITNLKQAKAEIESFNAELEKQIEQRTEELKANELYLATALRISKSACWEYDVATQQFNFNDSFYRVLRTRAESVGGYHLSPEAYASQFLIPEERDSVTRELQAAIRSNNPNFSRFLEHYCLFGDGQIGTVGVRARVECDASGKVTKIIGVIQDVTESKRTEEALRQSEQSLHHAQAIAHLGSWTLDHSTNTLTWSDEVYRIFGLDPQALEVSYPAFLECIHPEDRERVHKAYQASIQESQDSYEIVHRIVRKETGEIRYVQERCEHIRSSSGQVLRSTGTVHDITKLKVAQNQLRESMVLLRLVLDTTPAAVFWKDRECRYLGCNKSFASLAGLNDPAEIIGKNDFDMPWASRYAEKYRSDDFQVMEEGMPRHHIVEALESAGGKQSWIDTSKVPLRDTSGAIFGVLGLFEDITTRRETEAQLKESLLFRREAEKVGRMGAWKSNPATNFLYWTEGIYELLQAPSDYQPSHSESLRHFLLPGYIPQVEAALKATFETGTPFSLEVEITTTQGNRLWVEMRGLNRVEEDGSTYIMGTFQDITPRKARDEELQKSRDIYLSLLKSAPSLVWRANLDAKCDWFNDRWLTFTGRKLEQEMGEGWLEGVHPEDLDRCLNFYLESFAHREAFEMDYRLRRHDGVYRWISDKGVPFHDLSGKFAGYVGFCNDIHDRKTREQYDGLRLETLQKMAGNASLTEVLNAIVLLLEFGHQDWIGSIMVVDKSGTTLSCGAGPNLPQSYRDSLHGVPIRPNLGSCCAAVATEEMVLTEDIRKDPNWAPFRDLVEPTGLRSCWSIPIRVANEAPMGALAVYKQVKALPTEAELASMKSIMDLAAVALSQDAAQKALQESRHRLTMALDAAAMGVWEYDFGNRRIFWSPEIYKVLKLENEEPTLDLVDALIHPEDRQVPRQAMKLALEQKAAFHCEFRLIRDNRILWVESRGQILWEDAKRPIRVVGTVQDISSRKQSEQQSSEHLQKMHRLSELSLQLGGDDVEVVFNRAVSMIAELMNVPIVCISEVVGKDLCIRAQYNHGQLMRDQGAFPAEIAPCATVIDSRDLQAFQNVQEGFPKMTTFQEQGIQSYCGIPSTDEEGHVTAVTCLLDTEPRQYSEEDREILKLIGHRLSLELERFKRAAQRRTEEQLALRTQRLESIGTLAGGVAHDLNNALAPIMMSFELLQMDYPKESEILDTIIAGCRRAADMVRQLLTFAKGAEGERISIQINLLLKEMQNLIQSSFPKNIHLLIQRDPNLPTVRGDATQLHQVLLNLCVNARDAMPHGGTLKLEAKPVDVDASYASTIPDARTGPHVVLRVQDTGTGIPPEILEKIFDPFFTTKAADKGTGLGLATVMGIVKSHDGFLNVQSTPGKGTVFSVFLPAESQSDHETSHQQGGTEFRGNGETILFVDDEVSVRMTGQAVLQKLNFTVLTATDGADGMVQAATHRDELVAIITDVHMPSMDGLQFSRAVRRILPTTPIIVASGNLEEDVAAEIQSLGLTIRLDKPFTQDQLTSALKEALASAT